MLIDSDSDSGQIQIQFIELVARRLKIKKLNKQ